MGENVFQMYGVYALVGHLCNVLGLASRLFSPPVLIVKLVFPTDSLVWTRLNLPLSPRRLSHTSTQVGSCLFIVGGHDGGAYKDEVVLFNLGEYTSMVSNFSSKRTDALEHSEPPIRTTNSERETPFRARIPCDDPCR